ncbi:urease accessory protein UreF [Methylobacterium marchantiae]|uniref:Urease accessory protein UreF n=1 Tax=Methylobacterium marchantiae TaxID=600331 RepID=A0ABW3WVL4_9HYPH|nr:Urease accessory protein UreF [Methylobacterium marchantiae]
MLENLVALQQADSTFPSGSFAFSNGIEGLAALGERIGGEGFGGEGLSRAIEVVLRHRWAGSDRVALILSHRAGNDIDRLAAIDAAIEAATIAEPMRTGSRRNGAALLATHSRLGTPGAEDLRQAVRDRRLLGHLPIVQGTLWRALGLGEGAVAQIAGYQAAAGCVTAAIRLGIVGAIEAQRILTALLPILAEVAGRPLPESDPGEEDEIVLTAFTPLIEIAAARHARADLRLFAN